MSKTESRPAISIVMPCFNEERRIGRAISSLLEREPDNLEILVVDGGSRDGTREVVRRFGDCGAPIRLIENPRRRVSAAMNIGIREARGEWIVRADAHCAYPPGYVRRCVELLKATGAANAGGIQVPIVEKRSVAGGRIQAAVAAAMRHPLGVGDARWRLGRRSGFVDTVYLGTFRRSLFDEIGYYDEDADANQDAELNMRILAAGKKIYLDHTLEVIYYPRESFGGLARQYFRYGRGRARTALKHRRLTSWRQAAAPVLLIGLGGSLIAAIWMPVFLLAPTAYAATLAGVAIVSRLPGPVDRGRDAVAGDSMGMGARLLVAAAWAVMHMSWGAGFLGRLIFKGRR